MSAAKDLQDLIKQRLTAKATATVGNGSATEFSITHNLGSRAIYLSVRKGDENLVSGTDYSVALTSENAVTLAALKGAPTMNAWTVTVSLLRKDVPVVAVRPNELARDIEAAAAKHQLGIYVFPPLPTKITPHVPFVFVEECELRVTIVEQPSSNRTGVDAFDLVDDVMMGLHWQKFPTMLAVPLELAPRPTEMIWDPSTRMNGLAANTRMIDVIFHATYGLQPATTET